MIESGSELTASPEQIGLCILHQQVDRFLKFYFQILLFEQKIEKNQQEEWRLDIAPRHADCSSSRCYTSKAGTTQMDLPKKQHFQAFSGSLGSLKYFRTSLIAFLSKSLCSQLFNNVMRTFSKNFRKTGYVASFIRNVTKQSQDAGDEASLMFSH